MGGISIWQLLIVAVIVILLFGTKKLRNMGGDLGSAIKGFKSAIGDEKKTDSLDENELAGIMTKLLGDKETVEKMSKNLLARQMEYAWSTALKGYLDEDYA